MLGIGKAIAQKLAGQDISVVLVALDDNILQHTFDELKKTYPSVEFRKVELCVEIQVSMVPALFLSSICFFSVCVCFGFLCLVVFCFLSFMMLEIF